MSVTVVPLVETSAIVSPSPIKGTPGGELESITVMVAVAAVVPTVSFVIVEPTEEL